MVAVAQKLICLVLKNGKRLACNKVKDLHECLALIRANNGLFPPRI